MLLRSLQLTNILSFGPESEPISFGPLNVLIGPNGVGKSNVLEIINLLRAAPADILEPIRDGGGVGDWIWKGGPPGARAKIQALVDYAQDGIQYSLEFRQTGQQFEIVSEEVNGGKRREGEDEPFHFYQLRDGWGYISAKDADKRHREREEVELTQSILSQRKDPQQLPEITHLGTVLSKIRLYREWVFGRYTAPRLTQKADQQKNFLEQDFTNLGLVLNSLAADFKSKRKFLEAIKCLYDGIQDFGVDIEGGRVQVYLHENGMKIPATRLSDGTLRFLCLAAVLLHPNPPPLICIEEPELGLHPDIIQSVVTMLLDASQRTQVIATTHSEILVDALTDHPEAIIACDKEHGATVLRRLRPELLAPWLEKYRLGALWMQGEVGGLRW